MKSFVRVQFCIVALLFVIVATGVAGQSTCAMPGSIRESMRIGSVDGDDALAGILDLAIGPQGEVFLAQQFTPHVAVFSPAGRPIGTVGRAGSGPGEFTGWPIRLGWIRDTLWVTDRSSTQFFDPDGSAAWQSEWRLIVPEEASSLSPGPPLADGTFLARRGAATAGGGDMADMFLAARHALTRISAAGEVIDTIAHVRTRMSVGFETVGGPGFAQHPLAGSWRGFHQFADTPDGESILLPGQVDAAGGTFGIVRMGIDADTLLDLRVPYEPKPVTTADRRWLTEEFGRFQAGEYDSGSSPFSRSDAVRERDRRAAEDAITFPDHYPPIRQIVAGLDGSIWVLRELDPPTLTDRWEVFDRDGRPLGTLVISESRSGVLPWMPRLNVLQATETQLWGSTIGEFDEPYVHRYDVTLPCR